MKIEKFLVFAPFYEPHIGGLESYAKELNLHLVKFHIKITVFTPEIPKSCPVEENKAILVLRYPAFEIVPNYPIPCFWKNDFWKQWRRIGNANFDVVISHTRFFLSSVMAMIYSKFSKKKWIHIEHGTSFVESKDLLVYILSRLYDLTLGRLVLMRSDMNIAICKSVAEFVGKFDKRPVRIIYRGFEKKDFEKDDSYRLINKSKVNLCYIGRLISGKGLDTLLEVLSKISEDNWKLFVVGDGPEKNNLVKMVSFLNLGGKVEFIGMLSHKQAMSVLNESNIFINPSKSEGLPTTVIEAAYYGKAIIASDVGGTSEIINNDSGILYKTSDELQHALKDMIDNKALRIRLGKEAYKKVANQFSWESTIDTFMSCVILK